MGKRAVSQKRIIRDNTEALPWPRQDTLFNLL